MTAVLTKEDIVSWRRSTERITLEDYAKRLGKVVSAEKETNDLHDILNKKVEEVVEIVEVVEKVKEAEIPQKPDIEIKILSKRS